MINYPTLYKRNANGIPVMWKIQEYHDKIHISHGIVNKKVISETIPYTMKSLEAEIKSRYDAKRKEGYKTLTEVKDSTIEQIEGPYIYEYLNTYLPKYNTTNDGLILPMLAKTLIDNKPFNKFDTMLGQWKINGLRCIVGLKSNPNDLFKTIEVTYQSREGTSWNILDLDDYILSAISPELKDMMLEDNVYLDGELYIPGLSVNEINSAVKNPNNPWHHCLQYWIYDICADYSALSRHEIINEELYKYIPSWSNKNDHFCNENRIIVLPTYDVNSFYEAVTYRNKFIDLGFEGLILRNPSSEYLFGKRSVNGMYKFKRKDDGFFAILDIIPEGTRSNLPKFVCKNDINDETFEVTLNTSQDIQETILKEKDKYINKAFMLVEYRERSGVKNVPFHAKGIKLVTI